MIVIEDRIWSDYACGERMWIIYIGAFAGILAWVAGYLVLVYVRSRLSGNRHSAIGPLIAIRDRTAIWSCVGLLAVVAIGFSFLFALSPSLTAILTDGRVLVEKGCHRSEAYEKTIELASAEIRYERSQPLHRAPRHTLVIRQDMNEVRFGLKWFGRLDVLARIAPVQLKHYVDYLRQENRHIPAALRHL